MTLFNTHYTYAYRAVKDRLFTFEWKGSNAYDTYISMIFIMTVETSYNGIELKSEKVTILRYIILQFVIKYISEVVFVYITFNLTNVVYE